MARSRRLVSALGKVALAGLAAAVPLVAVEVVLRVAPGLMPAGGYGTLIVSPEIGMGVHGSPLLYNKARTVTRAPNGDGFLDASHSRAKPPGTIRVGVFGDSYVEAAQVPLEAVFFRRLGASLAPDGVEVLAFGISGWGTIHGMLAHRVYGPAYGLDAVVYVFVENDPGDNSFEIEGGTPTAVAKPLAVLADEPPGFVLHWTERAGSQRWFSPALEYLNRESRIAAVIGSRLRMLRAHGVNVRADERAAAMTERADGGLPDASDLLDSWPPDLRERTAELLRRILRQWRDEVDARGVPLYVLYVPRGEAQLQGDVPLASTWRPWLEAVTRELDIPLVDPAPDLAARLATGDHVYDDHFTPAGHEVIADVLARTLSPLISHSVRATPAAADGG